MRVGFALANIGPIGTKDNLIRIAQRAEALAYDSLWAVERLLWPVKPQSAYPLTPDGSLPGVALLSGWVWLTFGDPRSRGGDASGRGAMRRWLAHTLCA
jgi:alkanesulfonate monooxygenase SsuD/methylene tetrahydromethanopterin reductase-like flavin-dependent oxidoreductase (luciferase family)